MYLVVYRKHMDIGGVIISPCNYFAAVIFKIGKFSMIYLAFYALNYVFLLNCKNIYLIQVILFEYTLFMTWCFCSSISEVHEFQIFVLMLCASTLFIAFASVWCSWSVFTWKESKKKLCGICNFYYLL